MLDNIEYRELNKKKILLSVLFLPLVCFIVLSIIGLWFTLTDANEIDAGQLIQNLLYSPLYVMIMSAFVWIPVLIVQIFIESISIKANTNIKSWVMMLLYESLVMVLLIMTFTLRNVGIMAGCIIVISASQTFRAIYIKKTGIN